MTFAQGIVLLAALLVIFVLLVMPERPAPEDGVPRRALGDGEWPGDPGGAAVEAELSRLGFEGPLRFAFGEDPRPAALHVNRNLAVFALRHPGAPGELRFLTFLTDGAILVTGDAPFSYRSLDGSGLVYGNVHAEGPAALLDRHAHALRDAVAAGRMPKHAALETFFLDLQETVDLADAERVRELHARFDAGRFASPDLSGAAAVAQVILRRRRDGVTLLATPHEVSAERCDPLPAALLAPGPDTFPLKDYRAARPASAIPVDVMSCILVDRYGDGPDEWGFAVLSLDGRVLWLQAPDVEPLAGPRRARPEDELLALGWYVREHAPAVQVARYRREGGRPVEERG